MPSREIKIAILGDPSSLQSALRTADQGVDQFGRRMQSVGQRMQRVGSTLTRSLTLPLVGFGILAFRELSAGERALAQTEAVIESTGGAARKSVQDIVELSSALSEMSSVDDEDIQEMANTLLTFRSIAGDTFDEATEATLNMSVALGKDLRSSAIMVGKALNDPVAGMSALGRAGVQFNDEFEDTGYTMRQAIEWMVAMGDTAGAQQIILSELNQEFGGSAEALGNTLTGRLNRAKQRFEELGAAILENLIPVIEDLAGIVESLANAFDELTPKQQKIVAGAIAFAAVAGPLSSAIGLVTSALGAMSAALGISTGLILAIIAAIAVLAVGIYLLATNWDTARMAVTNFATNLVNNIPGARAHVDALKGAVNALSGIFSAAKAQVQQFVVQARTIADISLDGIIGAFNGLLSIIRSCIDAVFGLVDAIASALSSAPSLNSLGAAIPGVVTPRAAVNKGAPGRGGNEDVMYRAMRRALRDQVQLVKAV